MQRPSLLINVNNESYCYSQQSTMVLQTILKFTILHRTRKKIVLCTKSNSKYIKDPNVRSETLNLLGETKGKCSKIQTLGKAFLKEILIAQKIISRIDK